MSRKQLGVCVLAVSASLCAPAYAQESPPPQSAETEAEDQGIGEILVTARKTSENLQTTPVAVTAVTAELLDKAQINNVNQLQNIAPGLVVYPATAQPGSAQFSLRGQAQNDGLIAVDQSVGAYVDGVYVARSSGSLFNFVDVERVEILRGPQGTLFGRNTTGGSVNVITKAPTDNLEGMLRARYGNYDAWEATGVVNLPIASANGGLRMVYQHTQHDGYGRNVLFNERTGGDKTDFARATLRVASEDERLALSVRGDFTDRRTGGEMVGLKRFTATGTNGALVGICSGPAARPTCPVIRPAGDTLANYAVDIIGKDNFFDFFNSMPGIYGDAKTFGASATIDYELSDAISLKSISAVRKIDTNSLSDNDGTPYVFSGGVVENEGNFIDQKQFSQELQLNGKAFENRFNYILGAFYFRETGHDQSLSRSVFPLAGALNYVDADVRNKSYALYGQGTFNITDTVRFTGGLRYTQDKRFIVRRNRAENPPGSGIFACTMAANSLDADGFRIQTGAVCQATNRVTYDYLSYTASLDWEATDDFFFYAKTSRAYRSGGFNTRAITGGSAVGFEPEKVTDYELGGKFDFFDRRARLNVAAFYTDYTNVQRNIPVVAPGTVTLTSGVQNAAAATIKGLELEFTVRPIENLTLGASATFLDPKFDKFTLPVTTRSGGVAIVDASSSPYVLTPKKNFLVQADYELPTSFGSVNLHADYAYRGKYFSNGPISYPGVDGPNGYNPSFGFVTPGTSRIPGWGILNAQLSFHLEDPDLEVALYGRNILKKKYFARLLALEDTALGITAYLPGDPRTYGVSVTHKFGGY